MVPVCDKRYHIYIRFRHFWADIKKLWNYPLVVLCTNKTYRTEATKSVLCDPVYPEGKVWILCDIVLKVSREFKKERYSRTLKC